MPITTWIKKWARAAVILLYGCQPCPAETLAGYDALGLAKYCRTYLEAPNLPAVSTLLDTFGNPLPCLDKKAETGTLKLIQVDLRDATCWRNRACPTGTPKLENWDYLRAKARVLGAAAKKHPNIEWWASPWLEHDIRDAKKVIKACEIIQEECPQCFCVNTPFTGAKPKGIPIERHGTKAKAFMVSADGNSTFDADNRKHDGNKFEHRTAGSYATFAWWPELNLRCTGESKFVQPKNRRERPTADQFEQAASLLLTEEQPRPAPPTQCRTERETNPAAGEISKTNAQSYCNGQRKDPRGNRPLLILQRSGKIGDKLPVLDETGQQVGCYLYGGRFEGKGLHRWYMGNCSGQTPTGLKRALRGEWGWVELGEGNCLAVNAIRRMGSYK